MFGFIVRRDAGSAWPVSFRTRGKTLLQHCRDHHVDIDGGWEAFGTLSSCTTMIRPSRVVLVLESSLVDSLLPAMVVLRRGLDESIRLLNQLFPLWTQIHQQKIEFLGISKRPLNGFISITGNFALVRLSEQLQRSDNASEGDSENSVASCLASPLPDKRIPKMKPYSHVKRARSPVDLAQSPKVGMLATPESHMNTDRRNCNHGNIDNNAVGNNTTTKVEYQEDTAKTADQKTSRPTSKRRRGDELGMSFRGLSHHSGTEPNSIQPVNQLMSLDTSQQNVSNSAQAMDASEPSKKSYAASNAEQESPAHFPEFDGTSWSETEHESSASIGMPVEREGKEIGSTQASFSNAPEESENATKEEHTQEKCLLEKFGLWASVATTQVHQSHAFATENHSSSQSNHRMYKDDQQGIADDKSSESGQNEPESDREEKEISSRHGSPDNLPHNLAPLLMSDMASIDGSSTVEFPISSPVLAEDYDSERAFDPRTPSPPPENKMATTSTDKGSDKSQRKRNGEGERSEDGKEKMSKKKTKRNQSDFKLDSPEAEELRKKQADDEESVLETPKKLDDDFEKKYAMWNGEKEFQWESLDQTDLMSVQQEERVGETTTTEAVSPSDKNCDKETKKECETIWLLCSEEFTERYGAVTIAHLANGPTLKQSSIFPTMEHRIKFIDSPLVDARGVDIEIPNQGAIIVLSVSSFEVNGVEQVLKNLLDVTASTRYQTVEVLICINKPLDDQNNQHIARLQCALFRHKQFPRIFVAFRYTLPSALACNISEIVSKTDFTGWADVMNSKTETILTNPLTVLRLSFLLDIVPSLSATMVLMLLQHSMKEKQDCPSLESWEDVPVDVYFQHLFLKDWLELEDPRRLNMIGEAAATQLSFMLDVELDQTSKEAFLG
jgi:hypothetical protein